MRITSVAGTDMVEASHRYTCGAVQGNVLLITIQAAQLRDPSDAQVCRDEMIALVDASNLQHLIIDFGQVSFIGSVGLVALLGVRRHLQPR